jgi:sigma54-dependent transcription regulator
MTIAHSAITRNLTYLTSSDAEREIADDRKSAIQKCMAAAEAAGLTDLVDWADAALDSFDGDGCGQVVDNCDESTPLCDGEHTSTASDFHDVHAINQWITAGYKKDERV